MRVAPIDACAPFGPLALRAPRPGTWLQPAPPAPSAPWPAGAPWPTPGPAAPGPALPCLRVWVVDDDPLVGLYLGELLQDQGLAARIFSDPCRALAAYEADPAALDVLVTDQRMPVLSGETLARAVLARRPQLPVILCTAYSDQLDEPRALALGIRHFFRKPFDALALLRAIRGQAADPH